MSVGIGRLNPAFGSSRSASSAYQKWPNRHSHSTPGSTPSFAPIPRSDDRFARQDRYGPPPEFPLASPCPGIVHHLSGPNACAHAPPPRRGGRDGPVVRPRRTGEASGSHLGRRGGGDTGAGEGGTRGRGENPPGPATARPAPERPRRPSPSLRHGGFRASPRLAHALDSLVRVSRRVGWVADVAAETVCSLRPIPSPPEGGREKGARGSTTPPDPTARRARGALGTVRPAPGPPREREAGVEERSRRGRGGPAPPRHRRALRGGEPPRGGPPARGESAGRGESAATGPGSLGPGIRRTLLLGGAVTPGGPEVPRAPRGRHRTRPHPPGRRRPRDPSRPLYRSFLSSLTPPRQLNPSAAAGNTVTGEGPHRHGRPGNGRVPPPRPAPTCESGHTGTDDEGDAGKTATTTRRSPEGPRRRQPLRIAEGHPRAELAPRARARSAGPCSFR
ncbi:basic proline-rich protein-like [Dipodomys spectabilis]|uniref:basic proline-rich protein-like n=1 Tax=Dipodomys spectabilis TaxID=105255 RepID=UPI001C544BC4|nr:basic proline-rich protein-like [Dipodomys spectabilis]